MAWISMTFTDDAERGTALGIVLSGIGLGYIGKYYI